MRAVQPGAVGDLPSLQLPIFEYIDSNTGLAYARMIGGFIGFVGVGWAVGFLAVATRSRLPNLRRIMIYAPIVGGVVLGVSTLASQIGQLQVVSDVLAGPRTVEAVTGTDNSLIQVAQLLLLLGTFALAVGVVLVSLNAMRAGLLTRMLGYLGDRGGRADGDHLRRDADRADLLARGARLHPDGPVAGRRAAGLAHRAGGAVAGSRTPAAGNTPNGDATGDHFAREVPGAGAGGSPSQAKEAPLASRQEEAPHGDRRPDARTAAGGAPGSGEVPAARRVRRAGGRVRRRDLRAGRGLRGLLGRACRGAALGHQVGPGPGLVEPAVREVVRRRQAQRLLQLPRPPRRGRRRRAASPTTGDGEEGEELDVTYAELHARGPALRQRAEGARRREGRRRRDLPADDPRGAVGDARLRPHRRDPLGRLRWLRGRVAQGAHRGLRRQRLHHRRRLSAAARSST